MQWSTDAPIYKQLADIISDTILQGVYQDGDTLPSVRQISSEYEINHITVAKSYQTLVDIDVLEMKRGRGMFVKQGGSEILKAYKKSQFIKMTLPSLVQQMAVLQLTEDEIINAIRDIQKKESL